jgi:hypothetical protein
VNASAVRLAIVTLVAVVPCQSALAQQPQADGSAFALHAGPAYARIPDAEFDIVGSLSGQDLFAQTDAREGRLDFGAFVSQRLWAAGTDGPRLYATLGTAVNRPGRLLYLGGSIGASRALFTVGVATALVESGVQPVPDVVFPTTQQRTLFGSLERTRHWGLFVAASIGLVQ